MLRLDNSYNVYSAGNTSTIITTLPFTGTQNGFIVQYNASGAVQWAAKIGNAGTVVVRGVSTDSNRNVLVFGYYTAAMNVYSAGDTSTAITTLPFTGTNNGFIIQYNASGAVQWAANIGNSGIARALGVSTDSNRNVLVVGYYTAALNLYSAGDTSTAITTLPLTGTRNGFTVQYNSSGVVQWAKAVSGTGTTVQVYGTATDTANNVYGAAYSNSLTTTF